MKFSRLVALAEETVATTQRKLPPEVRTVAQTVPVHYEKQPDPSILAEGFEPDILGLFIGNPHGTELSHNDPAPPQILLYISSLWDYSDGDIEIYRDEVRLTYLHELGHYLGWDEEQVAARGLD